MKVVFEERKLFQNVKKKKIIQQKIPSFFTDPVYCIVLYVYISFQMTCDNTETSTQETVTNRE